MCYRNVTSDDSQYVNSACKTAEMRDLTTPRSHRSDPCRHNVCVAAPVRVAQYWQMSLHRVIVSGLLAATLVIKNEHN